MAVSFGDQEHGQSMPNSKRLGFHPTAFSGLGPEEAMERCVALETWLRWNEAYERVTELMYRKGIGNKELEDYMDAMDQLRLRAVTLSRRIVNAKLRK